MNEKQQQLIFDKGITNVPSDHICSDNALADASNLIYNNGQHHVIQKPAPFIIPTTGQVIPTLLYIHKFNDQERYIGYTPIVHEGTTYDTLVWGTITGTTYSQDGTFNLAYNNAKVTSVGKTLIIADDSGLHYYLWREDGNAHYESLGDSFPRPEVEYRLDDRFERAYADSFLTGNAVYYDSDTATYKLTLGQQDNWNNAVIGLYSSLEKKISQAKRFRGSFCVRAALELYDGTYYHIQNPVFMLNHFSVWGVGSLHGTQSIYLSMLLYGQVLRYRFYQDYTKWSDIIKNVVLFVTREAKPVDVTVDALINKGSSIPDAAQTPVSYFMSGNQIYADSRKLNTTDLYQVLKSQPDEDLEKTIKEGVYYKLCEIGLIGNAAGDDTWHDAADHFDTHTIENITTQTQLGEDDYFSHCPMKAGIVYPYNSRLNLASVQRGFFEGFDNFMPFTTPLGGSANPSSIYTFVVTISTDSGDYQVKHSKSTTQIQGLYFYYPDNRARHVKIWKGNDLILNADLTEHPTLHGAYYFAGVSKDMDEPTGSPEDIPSGDNGQFEILPNYVITSEVNNPFVFKAEGYNKVGTGKIIGLSTTTMALSQDSYGRTDLMVFSDSGIWGMAVDRTGLFSSIHPFSREVCNNPRSITPTDGAIFFASAKGLMMATDAGVKCVSTQLSGKTTNSFIEYMKTAFIAYDYRDSLLWLLNRSSTYNGYHYVYAIRSGAFSKAYLPNVSNALNNYPDYLVQIEANEELEEDGVFSMAERKDINEDSNTYTASIVSRPLKLENAIALKSIMQAKHIIDLSTGASMKWMVEASNNTKTWVQLTSLRGIPWKYYRFTYTFFSLAATDTFSGTILITQERRTNRMR